MMNSIKNSTLIRRFGMKKLVIMMIALVIIIAGVLFLVFRSGSSDSDKVFVQNVGEITGSSSVVSRFSGVVETQKTVNLTLDSTKLVSKVYVKEGTQVKKGDPLFSYDTQALELKISQMQIEIEKYDSTITNLKEQISQLKATTGSTSAERLEYAAQIKQAQADISQAEYDKKTKQAELSSKQKELDNSTVCAEIDGTIQSIAQTETTAGSDGQSVTTVTGSSTSESSGGESGQVFIKLVADGAFCVKGSVGEQSIGSISKGDTVIIRSRVDSEQIWKGTVYSVNTQPSSETSSSDTSSENSSSSKYPFTVLLEDSEGLMLGQHVLVEPDYGQENSGTGISLNSGWLVQEEDGSCSVWVCDQVGDKLKKQQVTLGEYDAQLDAYEITEGLTSEQYLAWPDETCKEGAATTAFSTETVEE